MNDEKEKEEATNEETVLHNVAVAHNVSVAALERAVLLDKAEPVKLVGFDISIKEWIIILFKVNVAVACIAIPVFVLMAAIFG